ncbi:MAG TPA: 4Fe-4S dicluster domain-containing protein [Candidatus Cybelea sp.]|nr:4Fe-4S dicluster domain-containing protein [Candidatus Cybelea sp.]
MSKDCFQIGDCAVVEREHFDSLFEALKARGYEVVGPTVREGAIAYDRVSCATDLPCGWTDEQEGGKYRLKRRPDEALFGYAVGPHSWKKFYFPSVQRLYKAELNADGFRITPEPEDTKKYAFIGVRACELRAISIQDKVFTGGPYVDPVYKSRRSHLFIVAVNCAVAGGTCFCASMGTGPKASAGYDLALTEIIDNGRHGFLVEVGSKGGAEILGEIPSRPAAGEEKLAADRIVEETSRHMGRSMDASDLKELLYRNYEHPRWDDVANRCLTCANCTMVCPTCFCTTVEDVTDLTGEHAERWRSWDSCFTMDFSYIHGGSIRATAKSRYRQWMTHKLATWIDQFGESGCVGCGRCITWCPVGIDITEEVRAIRASDPAAGGTP